MLKRPTLYTMSAFILCSAPVQADEQPAQKLNDSAQAAFDQGKFKKAETGWTKAIKTMEDNGQKDSFLESCLKRLGQTYKKMERTVDAYQTLMRAFEMCNAMGVRDQELAQELTDLSTTYRAVDVAALGDGTAKALKKANVSSVGLIKTGTGTKMQVDLPEKFEKQLDDQKIDGLAFDKQVTLDLDENADGTVSLKNIKGFKIHAKEQNMWVNLLQAVFSPADINGEYPTAVTAGKMGVTKTVNASLPAKGYEPISGLLKQLKAMVAPVPVAFAGATPVVASLADVATTAVSVSAAPETAPSASAATASSALSEATSSVTPGAASAVTPVTPSPATFASPAVPPAPGVSVAVSTSVLPIIAAQPGASSTFPAVPAAASASAACKAIFDDIEKLVRTYYFRAKFKRSDNSLHFEYKSRIDMVRPPEKNGETQKEVQEVVADWGGVVGDLQLHAGKYTGAENMPLLLKNRSSYEVYLNAPYSQQYDSYLEVRLSYPFDANLDFLKSFKDDSSEFGG